MVVFQLALKQLLGIYQETHSQMQLKLPHLLLQELQSALIPVLDKGMLIQKKQKFLNIPAHFLPSD